WSFSPSRSAQRASTRDPRGHAWRALGSWRPACLGPLLRTTPSGDIVLSTWLAPFLMAHACIAQVAQDRRRVAASDAIAFAVARNAPVDDGSDLSTQRLKLVVGHG